MEFNEDDYLDIEQRQEIRNKARMFRRKLLRYKEAEWIYSINKYNAKESAKRKYDHLYGLFHDRFAGSFAFLMYGSGHMTVFPFCENSGMEEK